MLLERGVSVFFRGKMGRFVAVDVPGVHRTRAPVREVLLSESISVMDAPGDDIFGEHRSCDIITLSDITTHLF